MNRRELFPILASGALGVGVSARDALATPAVSAILQNRLNAEITRIEVALRQATGVRYDALYYAQQALVWAKDPSTFGAPLAVADTFYPAPGPNDPTDDRGVIVYEDGRRATFDTSGIGTGRGAAFSDAHLDAMFEHQSPVAHVEVTRSAFKAMARDNLVDWVHGDPGEKLLPTFMGRLLSVPGTSLAFA